MPPVSRRLKTAAILITFTLVCASAQTLDQAASQLASSIGSAVQIKSGLSLGIENLSSLTIPEVTRVRDTIQAELIRAGLKVDSNSLTLIQITISENARGFLLIARTPAPDGVKTAMVSWTIRPARPSTARTALSKSLILEHSSPVLDIALTSNGAELWVLEPARLLHFVKNAEAWTADRTTPLSLARPLSRNPRGRLTPDPRMPDISSPWPLDSSHTVRWAAGRNYLFDDSGSFFSAATIDNFEFKAGLDGRTRMMSPAGQLIANIDDWGSDLAAIQGSCGQPFLLATAKTERDGLDRIQAYQLSDSQPVPSGDPLSFPGLVTALWPSETPAQATAVVHNRKTQKYEAYRIAISCSN